MSKSRGQSRFDYINVIYDTKGYTLSIPTSKYFLKSYRTRLQNSVQYFAEGLLYSTGQVLRWKVTEKQPMALRCTSQHRNGRRWQWKRSLWWALQGPKGIFRQAEKRPVVRVWLWQLRGDVQKGSDVSVPMGSHWATPCQITRLLSLNPLK